MKYVTDNKTRSLPLKTVMVGLLLTGLMSACAPPSATDSALNTELALLQQQQQQQQQTLLAIQQALTQLQQKMGIVTADAIAPSPATGVSESQPQPSQSPQAEDVENLVAAAASYLEAFSALAMGRYEQALSGFNAFLQDFPTHHYTPDARYWLAETELFLGRVQQAEANLLMVANDHQRDNKAPEALSRLVQLYRQQNLTEQAEDILHQLRTRFPESREVQHFNRSEQTQ